MNLNWKKYFLFLLQGFATKNKSFWQKQLTPENVRALLFDDESVRKMLAAPETTAKELKDSGAYEIFCDFVEDRFGGRSYVRIIQLNGLASLPLILS